MGAAERRVREKEERRSSILDAAERVFLHKGLTASTMDEIAHEAEVSKGTLYLYFKGKDELYLTIAIRTLSEMVHRFEATAAGPGTGLDRLRRLTLAHAAFALENHDRFRVATSWLTTGYTVVDDSPLFDEYKALIAQLFRYGVEAIEGGKRDGSVREDVSSAELAMQVWGATLGVLMIRMSSSEVLRRMPRPIDMDALVPSFLDLVLGAIAREGRS